MLIPTLSLHVGLMKCGSTSLQIALSAQRLRLRTEGVHYPDTGQINHMLPFSELLWSDVVARSRFPPGLLRHLSAIQRPLSGSLAKLVSSSRILDNNSRLVLSAENLIYAGPATMGQIRAQFGTAELRVVVGRRKLSSLLPSNYQQQARIQPVPHFDLWARSALYDLARGTYRSSLWSLRTDLLVRDWLRFADSIDVVDVDTPGGLERMWGKLVGDGIAMDEVGPRANVSLPFEVVAAIQSYIRSHPRRSVSEIRSVVRASKTDACKTAPSAAPLSSLGICGDVSRVLDRAGRLIGNSQTADDEWAWILNRLASTEPVTQINYADGVTRRDIDAFSQEMYALLCRTDRRLTGPRMYRRIRGLQWRPVGGTTQSPR